MDDGVRTCCEYEHAKTPAFASSPACIACHAHLSEFLHTNPTRGQYTSESMQDKCVPVSFMWRVHHCWVHRDEDSQDIHGHITSLAVARTHRKLGLATRLMQATREWLAHTHTHTHTHTQTHARAH